MKKIILYIIGLFIVFPVFGRDFEYTYEGQTLTYTVIDEEEKTVMTKAGGEGSDFRGHAGNMVSGNLVIPQNVTDGEGVYTVVEIGSYAFYYCESMTSVIIPESVMSIGDFSFFGCHNLTSVIIPESVTSIGRDAFHACSCLTSVTIPKSVTWIDKMAFMYCSNLTSVTILGSNVRIWDRVFEDCDKLERAEFASIEALCKIDFYNDEANPLYYAHHLYIDGNEITKADIPDSVSSIGNYTFTGCTGLKSVTIPESITNIGKDAFSYCNNLTEVTIPNSVITIGEYAFYKCSGLTSITIPSNVTTIKNSSFRHCTELTSVTIPESVISIEHDAFGDCPMLQEIIIPESVVKLEDYVFEDCSGLKSVTIPQSLIQAGKYIFDDCNNIEKVYYIAEEPRTFDISFFSQATYDNATLYVNGASIKKYKAVDPWRIFKNISAREMTPVPAESISLSEDSWSGKVGDSFTLSAIVTPEDNDDSLIWESSDPSIVSVDNNGSVTAISVGEATITAICGEVSASCQVSVLPILIESITISPEYWSGKVGDYFALSATVSPKNATDKTLTLESSDETIATVDSNGLVKAINIGKVDIIAKTNDGSNISAVCHIEITPILIETISLTPYSFICSPGETFTIQASILPRNASNKKLEWMSSDEAIAKVDQEGNVTAVTPGDVIITAKALDGSEVEAVCNVVVKPMFAESIKLSPNSWTSYAGETVQLTATILPDNVTDKTVIWTSSNDAVATVDSNGNVMALAVGDAVITASCGNVSATCTITVIPILVESLTIDPIVWSGGEGTEFSINAIILPENATDKDLTFESSDITIASVDNYGHVIVLNDGFCTITVSTTDGSNLKAECEITCLSGIELIFTDPNAEIDVYDINGVMLKHACTRDQVKHLTPGVYLLRRGTTVVKLVMR